MKKTVISFLLLTCAAIAFAATDGTFTKTSPNYGSENAADAFDEIKENFAWIERDLLMAERFTGLTAYCATYTYSGSELTTITVYDATGTPPACAGNVKATGTLTYSSGNLVTEAWVINGKTLTYTYTYSGGNLARKSLVVS